MTGGVVRGRRTGERRVALPVPIGWTATGLASPSCAAGSLAAGASDTRAPDRGYPAGRRQSARPGSEHVAAASGGASGPMIGHGLRATANALVGRSEERAGLVDCCARARWQTGMPSERPRRRRPAMNTTISETSTRPTAATAAAPGLHPRGPPERRRAAVLRPPRVGPTGEALRAIAVHFHDETRKLARPPRPPRPRSAEVHLTKLPVRPDGSGATVMWPRLAGPRRSGLRSPRGVHRPGRRDHRRGPGGDRDAGDARACSWSWAR